VKFLKVNANVVNHLGMIRSEIDILKNITPHPNIVRFLGTHDYGEFILLFTELCQAITLEDQLELTGRIPERMLVNHLVEISRGLAHLHTSLIIHRDVKPSNIFFNADGNAVIGDFGMATRLSFRDQRRTKCCGTPAYIAPEMVASKSYSFPVDIWALGVMTYYLLVGDIPFFSDTVSDTYACIENGEYQRLSHEYSADIRRVVHTQLLVVDEQSRATAEDLADTFEKMKC